MLLATTEPGFRAFTALHYETVAVCVALMAGVAWLGRHWRLSQPALEKKLRRGLGWFCLGVYAAYLDWLWQPRNFTWERSLPLEFCDMGLLVAAGVLLTNVAWLRGLLYFWATVFALQAFFTPVLQQGPATPDFWLFWAAHLGIEAAVVYDLVVGKFRPAPADFTRSYVISFFYAAALMILDVLTGWNYGFVGPGKPSTPTLLDELGEFPLRIVWMLLMATLGFFIAWLPWTRKKRCP